MKFYDTSALLEEKLLEERFLISSITLSELENIKTSTTKDIKIKYQARKLLHFLDKNPDKYDTIIFRLSYLEPLDNMGFLINDDMRILACAIAYAGDIEFITNDLAQKKIAELFISKVSSTKEKEKYLGYKEITLSNDDMAYLYCNMDKNIFDLCINEYINIYNEDKELVDTLKWTENGYKKLKYVNFDSKWFGNIKPKDSYQQMTFDSLKTNQLTIIRGGQGCGKSTIGLGCLFSLLDAGKIDKIIMFVNPVATRDSCRFGFLPGDLEAKILGSQIGNFLSSKLGGIDAVYQLIDNHQLEFVALADARGYDTSNMRAGIYMTEAQNTTIDMMKLVLSRIGEDTICVIEGDDENQCDQASYDGNNNGLKRVCEVYKNEPYFGTITLKNCYRSRIATKASEM